MSLFGTSPEEQASDRARSSLFDDSTTAPAAGSALFNDDDAGDSSPWGMPTPKKASTGSLISRLLAGANIPDQYIDVFDAVSQGNGVDVGGMSRVMTSAKLGPDEQMTILEIMGKVGRNLGRDEFNVFMALVGLAQEGDDLDLDGVDERRKSK